MRQTFVVVSIVAGLLLWIAAAFAEPGKCRLAVTQVSAGYGVNGVDGLDGAITLAFAPGGTQLYTTGFPFSAVGIFARNAATGALTFAGRVADGENGIDGIGGASALAVRPDGLQVFVSGSNDSGLAAFGRDPATGALAFHEAELDGNGAAGLGGATGVAVSPDGAHVYVTGTNDNAVAVFAIQAP